MINIYQLSIDLVIYIGLTTTFLLTMLFYNPRLMLQDYPAEIKAVVPPKTEKEKQQSILLGLPFIVILLLYPFIAVYRIESTTFLQLFTYAFAIVWAFNLWDWIVLDWLIFCTITPHQLIIPGTKGHPAYKDYAFHFRGFLIGSVFSFIMGLIVAVVIYFMR